MEDIEKLNQLLKQIQSTFGIGMVFLVLVLGISFYFYWKYSIKKIEFFAQKHFEGVLTEIRIKAQKKYEKQIAAMHECYSKIQDIHLFLKHQKENNEVIKDLAPAEIAFRLKKLKIDFYEEYIKHKIVFSIDTCQKIESLIPALDFYIKEYEKGIWIASQVTHTTYNDGKGDKPVKVSGIWPVEEIDKLTLNLEQVIQNIETEFRELYQVK